MFENLVIDVISSPNPAYWLKNMVLDGKGIRRFLQSQLLPAGVDLNDMTIVKPRFVEVPSDAVNGPQRLVEGSPVSINPHGVMVSICRNSEETINAGEVINTQILFPYNYEGEMYLRVNKENGVGIWRVVSAANLDMTEYALIDSEAFSGTPLVPDAPVGSATDAILNMNILITTIKDFLNVDVIEFLASDWVLETRENSPYYNKFILPFNIDRKYVNNVYRWGTIDDGTEVVYGPANSRLNVNGEWATAILRYYESDGDSAITMQYQGSLGIFIPEEIRSGTIQASFESLLAIDRLSIEGTIDPVLDGRKAYYNRDNTLDANGYYGWTRYQNSDGYGPSQIWTTSALPNNEDQVYSDTVGTTYSTHLRNMFPHRLGFNSSGNITKDEDGYTNFYFSGGNSIYNHLPLTILNDANHAWFGMWYDETGNYEFKFSLTIITTTGEIYDFRTTEGTDKQISAGYDNFASGDALSSGTWVKRSIISDLGPYDTWLNTNGGWNSSSLRYYESSGDSVVAMNYPGSLGIFIPASIRNGSLSATFNSRGLDRISLRPTSNPGGNTKAYYNRDNTLDANGYYGWRRYFSGESYGPSVVWTASETPHNGDTVYNNTTGTVVTTFLWNQFPHRIGFNLDGYIIDNDGGWTLYDFSGGNSIYNHLPLTILNDANHAWFGMWNDEVTNFLFDFEIRITNTNGNIWIYETVPGTDKTITASGTGYTAAPALASGRWINVGVSDAVGLRLHTDQINIYTNDDGSATLSVDTLEETFAGRFTSISTDANIV